MFFIAFILDAAFSLSLCGFLIMHGRMVAQVRCSCVRRRAVEMGARCVWVELTVRNLLVQNRTTIEMYEKMYVTAWPYDKGWRRNIEEVCTQLTTTLHHSLDQEVFATSCSTPHQRGSAPLHRCLALTTDDGGCPHTHKDRRSQCLVQL